MLHNLELERTDNEPQRLKGSPQLLLLGNQQWLEVRATPEHRRELSKELIWAKMELLRPRAATHWPPIGPDLPWLMVRCEPCNQALNGRHQFFDHILCARHDRHTQEGGWDTPCTACANQPAVFKWDNCDHGPGIKGATLCGSCRSHYLDYSVYRLYRDAQGVLEWSCLFSPCVVCRVEGYLEPCLDASAWAPRKAGCFNVYGSEGPLVYHELDPRIQIAIWSRAGRKECVMDEGMLSFVHLNYIGPWDFGCHGQRGACELYHPLGMPCVNPCCRRIGHEGPCLCEECVNRVIRATPGGDKQVINLHTRLALRQCEYHDEEARMISMAPVVRTRDKLQQVITALAREQSARAESTAIIKSLGYKTQDWTAAQPEGEKSRSAQHRSRDKGQRAIEASRKRKSPEDRIFEFRRRWKYGSEEPSSSSRHSPGDDASIHPGSCQGDLCPAAGKATAAQEADSLALPRPSRRRFKLPGRTQTRWRAVKGASRRMRARCNLGRTNPYGNEGPSSSSRHSAPRGVESQTTQLTPHQKRINDEGLCWLCSGKLGTISRPKLPWEPCPSNECLNQFHSLCILKTVQSRSPFADRESRRYRCPWCSHARWYVKRDGTLRRAEDGTLVITTRFVKGSKIPLEYQPGLAASRRSEPGNPECRSGVKDRSVDQPTVEEQPLQGMTTEGSRAEAEPGPQAIAADLAERDSPITDEDGGGLVLPSLADYESALRREGTLAPPSPAPTRESSGLNPAAPEFVPAPRIPVLGAWAGDCRGLYGVRSPQTCAERHH